MIQIFVRVCICILFMRLNVLNQRKTVKYRRPKKRCITYHLIKINFCFIYNLMLKLDTIISKMLFQKIKTWNWQLLSYSNFSLAVSIDLLHPLPRSCQSIQVLKVYETILKLLVVAGLGGQFSLAVAVINVTVVSIQLLPLLPKVRIQTELVIYGFTDFGDLD